MGAPTGTSASARRVKALAQAACDASRHINTPARDVKSAQRGRKETHTEQPGFDSLMRASLMYANAGFVEELALTDAG
jgi:hypothetical protein